MSFQETELCVIITTFRIPDGHMKERNQLEYHKIVSYLIFSCKNERYVY